MPTFAFSFKFEGMTENKQNATIQQIAIGNGGPRSLRAIRFCTAGAAAPQAQGKKGTRRTVFRYCIALGYALYFSSPQGWSWVRSLTISNQRSALSHVRNGIWIVRLPAASPQQVKSALAGGPVRRSLTMTG